MQQEQKLNFLRLLVEHREELFGRHQTHIDRHAKRNSWTNIRKLCMQQGFDPLNGRSNWEYMRDKVFMNMKKTTKKNLERLNEHGKSMSNATLTEQDRLVLEVLGA